VSALRFRDAERGDVLLGWLTKLVVGLAVVGISGFDAISIGAAHVSATDDADSAAEAANSAWVDARGTATIQSLYDAAEADAEQHGDTIPPTSFTVAQNGDITLSLIHHATTIFVRHIGPLRHYTTVTVQGSATTPTP
jgi:hypothetical protein